MSVRVIFVGNLGNNLFQYAFGRIIAEHHGFLLDCREEQYASDPPQCITPLERNTARLSCLTSFFPDAPLEIPGHYVHSPVEAFSINLLPCWDGQSVELQRILDNKSPRHVWLKGYFQRYEYYREYEHQIRSWFRFRPMPTPFDIRDEDVLVNLRGGADFSANGWVLPFSYYERALALVSPKGRIYVCGVGLDEILIQRMRKFSPCYFTGSPMEHMSFFARFKTIVLSNSTFAWWAAFLSPATTLIAPATRRGHCFAFSGFGNVDLDMRSNRYHAVVIDEE